MNLISPVKNIQQTAISCPQRGLCHGMGAGFLDSFSVKSKGALLFKKAQAFMCLPNTISGLQKAVYSAILKANQIMLFYCAYKNIYRRNAILHTHTHTYTYTHAHTHT